MSHRVSYNLPGHVHFLTFSCFRRQPFLAEDPECADLAASLESARLAENFDLWAYVFMPEHVHLLIRPRGESYSMAVILRRIKEPVSRDVFVRWRQTGDLRLEAAVDRSHGPVSHRFWQPGGGFDRNLRTAESIETTIAYVEGNPVTRGLVAEPQQWRWSSARAKAGMTDAPLRLDAVTWPAVLH